MSLQTNETPAFNVDVSELQQHPPFRFVSAINKISDNAIETTLDLKGDEWFFQGHFPGLPIFPGVLQQESLFQSAALLMMAMAKRQSPDHPGKGLGVVTKVEQARFKKLITPPCNLNLQVELTEQQDHAFYFKGQIRYEGKIVSQVHFTCAQIEMLPNQ